MGVEVIETGDAFDGDVEWRGCEGFELILGFVGVHVLLIPVRVA